MSLAEKKYDARGPRRAAKAAVRAAKTKTVQQADGLRSGSRQTKVRKSEVLQRRLLRAIAEARLLRVGERVGVAVSGGADSVALLFLLAELRGELGLSLGVLHFHHGLRGRAADADEKFVARLAARLGLPFYFGRADVPKMARRGKWNVEDAARRARYAFFARCADEHRLDAVAVAHTADDQAETVLGHILRGSGITGLGGIHPRVGKMVRPLLGVRRHELRTYLLSRREKWREDATNRDESRTRARIRGKLMPFLERNFQARAVEHLAELARLARADERLLEEVVEKRFATAVKVLPEGVRIGAAELLGGDGPGGKYAAGPAEEALSRRLVRRIVRSLKERRGSPREGMGATGLRGNSGASDEIRRTDRVTGSEVGGERARGGELTGDHVEKILTLARCGRAGATLPLPGGIEVRRYADGLLFHAAGKGAAAAISFEYKLTPEKSLRDIAVPELGCVFRFRVIDWARERADTKSSGEVLDATRLRYPLRLRNWRFGDRFHAQGHSRPHKLKRLFSEKGVDRWRRDGWPVLVSGERLAWSREFGAAAEFAANSGTKTGIVIVEEQVE